MSREHAMGQLRHLYAQMRDGLTANGPMVADGLLGPAIATLETVESAEILRIRAEVARLESALSEARRERDEAREAVKDKEHALRLAHGDVKALNAALGAAREEARRLSTPADPDAPAWRDAALAQSDANNRLAHDLRSAREEAATRRAQVESLLSAHDALREEARAAREESERLKQAGRDALRLIRGDGEISAERADEVWAILRTAYYGGAAVSGRGDAT